MLAAPLLLAACQQAEPPANDLAAPAPKAHGEGDISTAERLVRQRLGTTGEIRFSGARRSASQGIAIVCGSYEQGGVRQRYLVVAGEEVFVEPRMRAGEMDRAFAEFCGEGTDNRPAPVIGREGNGL
jgi:hypothetical protein